VHTRERRDEVNVCISYSHAAELLRHQTTARRTFWRYLHCVSPILTDASASLLWYDYRWRRMDGLYQHVFK